MVSVEKHMAAVGIAALVALATIGSASACPNGHMTAIYQAGADGLIEGTSCAMTDTLREGNRLSLGDSPSGYGRAMLSDDNRYALVVQTDGNLVLYDTGGHFEVNDSAPVWAPVWATHTKNGQCVTLDHAGHFALMGGAGRDPCSGVGVWSPWRLMVGSDDESPAVRLLNSGSLVWSKGRGQTTITGPDTPYLLLKDGAPTLYTTGPVTHGCMSGTACSTNRTVPVVHCGVDRGVVVCWSGPTGCCEIEPQSGSIFTYRCDDRSPCCAGHPVNHP